MSSEKETTEKPEGCTCGEFMTAPCPIHQKNPSIKEDKYFGQNKIIVTDDQLVSNQMGVFQGFIFVCPVCKLPAIMVNSDMGKFCCNCGQRIDVHSKTVTDFVKQL